MSKKISKIDEIDPITLGIMASRLDSITREMTNTMIRTARSTTMAARDFSCSITSSENDLLSAPGGIPVHVYGSSLVAKDMQELHPEFKEGDAFLHNDPYMGNTHAADHTLIVPVFYEGEHVFTAIAKAHQVDIGNSQPTTYMPSARDVYEEGALIFPCVRVQDGYRDVNDVIGMARRRIRAFDTWYGDYLASLGACRLAEKRLKEFADSFASIEALRAFIREWLDYGERMAAAGIRKLPAAKIRVETTMDHFPGLPAEGMLLSAIVDIRPDEGKVVIDLRDNPDCTPTGLNLTEATSKNSAVTAVMMALNTDKTAKTLRVPNTSGSHRCIEVLVRENCVVGIPRHPASCSTATRTVTDRVSGMIVAGLANIQGAETGAAEPCLGCPPHEGVVSGRDPRLDGEEYVLQVFAGTSGGPATPEGDGWLAFSTIMGGGLSKIDSSEVVEQRYPLVIWQHAEVRTDSEGAGTHRSAPGAISAYGPSLAPAESHYYLEGISNPPRGVRGGGDGASAQAWKIAKDGSVKQINDIVVALKLDRNEAVVSMGSGAGGLGSPLERDPKLVLEDVIDEYVSVARARDVYGVVITGDPARWETLAVDTDATAKQREQLRTGGDLNMNAARATVAVDGWWLGAAG